MASAKVINIKNPDFPPDDASEGEIREFWKNRIRLECRDYRSIGDSYEAIRDCIKEKYNLDLSIEEIIKFTADVTGIPIQDNVKAQRSLAKYDNRNKSEDIEIIKNRYKHYTKIIENELSELPTNSQERLAALASLTFVNDYRLRRLCSLAIEDKIGDYMNGDRKAALEIAHLSRASDAFRITTTEYLKMAEVVEQIQVRDAWDYVENEH